MSRKSILTQVVMVAGRKYSYALLEINFPCVDLCEKNMGLVYDVNSISYCRR